MASQENNGTRPTNAKRTKHEINYYPRKMGIALVSSLAASSIHIHNSVSLTLFFCADIGNISVILSAIALAAIATGMVYAAPSCSSTRRDDTVAHSPMQIISAFFTVYIDSTSDCAERFVSF